MKSLQGEPYAGPLRKKHTKVESQHRGGCRERAQFKCSQGEGTVPPCGFSAQLELSVAREHIIIKSYPILLGLTIQTPKYTNIRQQAPCGQNLLLHPSSGSQSTSEILSESTIHQCLSQFTASPGSKGETSCCPNLDLNPHFNYFGVFESPFLI